MSAHKSHRVDRAIGAVLGSAAGDALGAPYEFKPSLPDAVPVVFKAGGGWELGEWTDDTSMAVPILQALSRGDALTDAATLDRIVAEWQGWARTAKDVGIQTRQVLGRLTEPSETTARASARAVHDVTGRSAGNGSLMRTGPVALGYLGDGDENALAVVARRISDLTHYETDAGDACVIWSLAIRHAIRTGEYDIRTAINALPVERRARWHDLLDVAERTQPRDIPGSNGWVVAALLAAWSAIHHAAAASEGLAETLERAVRCGNDTDTVAAIAGSLAGARWGGSAVPFLWRRELHGWPDLRAADLANLAILAVRGGAPDGQGWPTGPRVQLGRTDTLEQHPHDPGVWLGDIRALERLPAEIDAVVSLCRVGADQVPARIAARNRFTPWLIDRGNGENLNLDAVFLDVADAIATFRAEGRTVFVHCFEAQSRTPSIGAAYAVRHRDVGTDVALAHVTDALPNARPQAFFVDAVRRLAGSDRK